MIFNSLSYLLLLAIVVPAYWVLPRRPRLLLLLAASLIFYGFWRVEFIPVMLASALNDYLAALGIEASKSERRRKLLLGLSLTVNLGLLVYFKYLIFFAGNAVGLLQLFGWSVEPPRWSIVLPLGISFYTFQTISYTVDVYRGFTRAERDPVLYANFVMFFPQLVAGPILRASEVTAQLSERPAFRVDDLSEGLSRVVGGLFLKVVLADNVAPIVDEGFAMRTEALSALDVWTLAFLFGFQIYFDFSAYSHIALGCARMMGIHFPENFAFPYGATSPRDFWKRWHISLSSWIRDYLYLPLCGTKVLDHSQGGLVDPTGSVTEARRTIALFATWAIMGLWHGAAWTFVLWGLHHAVAVYFHRKFGPRIKQLPALLRQYGGWAITLPLMMLAWVPFRTAGLGDALRMYGRVLTPSAYGSLGMRENTYLVAALLMAFVIGAELTQARLLPALRVRPRVYAALETAGQTVAIALVFVFFRPVSQFIYFQF